MSLGERVSEAQFKLVKVVTMKWTELTVIRILVNKPASEARLEAKKPMALEMQMWIAEDKLG